MKNATRILIPSLSLGLLVKTLAVSHALAFTLFVDDVSPAGRDYAAPGAQTGANSQPALPRFINTLQPNSSGQTYDPDPTVSPYGSSVRYGLTQTSGGNPNVANNSATFGGIGSPTSTVQFTFALQNGDHQGDSGPDVASGGSGDPFARFQVQGYLTGTVGYGASKSAFSSANIVFTSITNLMPMGSDQVTSIASVDPANPALAALFIHATIGGQGYDIYLDSTRPISAPGKDPFSLEGFVGPTSAVPEPGSVALLMGVGVTGLALLRRRRK